MKVVYTGEALDNLDGILAYIASNYPTISRRLKSGSAGMITRIGAWPESAVEVAERPGVRVVPLSTSTNSATCDHRPPLR
jgi:hypothetical protein